MRKYRRFVENPEARSAGEQQWGVRNRHSTPFSGHCEFTAPSVSPDTVSGLQTVMSLSCHATARVSR
jgi:hypothetical protein